MHNSGGLTTLSGSIYALFDGLTTIFCIWQLDCIIWWLVHIIGVLLDGQVLGNSLWHVAEMGRNCFLKICTVSEKHCIDIIAMLTDKCDFVIVYLCICDLLYC